MAFHVNILPGAYVTIQFVLPCFVLGRKVVFAFLNLFSTLFCQKEKNTLAGPEQHWNIPTSDPALDSEISKIITSRLETYRYCSVSQGR